MKNQLLLTKSKKQNSVCKLIIQETGFPNYKRLCTNKTITEEEIPLKKDILH